MTLHVISLYTIHLFFYSISFSSFSFNYIPLSHHVLSLTTLSSSDTCLPPSATTVEDMSVPCTTSPACPVNHHLLVISPCCNRHAPTATTPSQSPTFAMNQDVSGGWIPVVLDQVVFYRPNLIVTLLWSSHIQSLYSDSIFMSVCDMNLILQICFCHCCVEEEEVKGRWCWREEEQLEREWGNYNERRRENDKIALLIKDEMTQLPMVIVLC